MMIRKLPMDVHIDRINRLIVPSLVPCSRGVGAFVPVIWAWDFSSFPAWKVFPHAETFGSGGFGSGKNLGNFPVNVLDRVRGEVC